MKKSVLVVLLSGILASMLMGCDSNVKTEEEKVVRDLKVQSFEEASANQFLEDVLDLRQQIIEAHALIEEAKESGKYDNDKDFLVDCAYIEYLYNNL